MHNASDFGFSIAGQTGGGENASEKTSKLSTLSAAEFVSLIVDKFEFSGAPVRVWLPGSTIALTSNVFVRDGEIHIEGNIDPGSALCSE